MSNLEKKHKQTLARLGCMVCRRLYGINHGEVELHHRRKGMGWGKGDYTTLIPLCPEHHRGSKGWHGTREEFKRHSVNEWDILADTIELVAKNMKG